MMKEHTPAELTDVAGNLQQKARESVQVPVSEAIGCGHDSISPTRQEAEKITPYPALQQYLSGPGGQGRRFNGILSLQTGYS